MTVSVCLAPRSSITYPEGGGALWVFLNWALGLRALGCEVVWLELAPRGDAASDLQRRVTLLRERLAPYGLDGAVALAPFPGNELPDGAAEGCVDLDAAAEADLLLNVRCGMPEQIVARFRRSVLLDVDPGLLQTWMSDRRFAVARHHAYITTGERVIDGDGHVWNHVPPCVALDWWPFTPRCENAAFTTVSHWHASAWTGDDDAREDKRAGFRPFLDLPSRTALPLELALDLAENHPEAQTLTERGWRVRCAHAVAGTPWDYQRYIQGSLGEFGCAKPAYVRLGNAWVSDRTPCFLASGKPAVVQHTGESSFLPEAAGIFRFRDPPEAAACLERIAADYERQSKLARALAEEHFGARRAAAQVLEMALP